jgi:hypothetical protein
MNAIESENCLNCGKKLDDSDRYCSFCGQSVNKDSSLSAFLSQFLSDYFTFDSKIFLSVKPLFVRPGFLTLEYLKGKRVSYIPPLRLFIFSSIIFFLLLSVLNLEQAKVEVGQSQEDYFWDRFFESFLPKLFFLLSPVFSLLLALFFRKSGSSLKHFIFSIHYHASIFSIGSIYLALSWLLALVDLQSINLILAVLISIYLLIYLFIAIRRAYNQKVKQLLWKLPLLGIIYASLVGVSVILLAFFSQ